MKIDDDSETDALTVSLRDERIQETEEVRPGILVDFGDDGGVVRFEILDASKQVQEPLSLMLSWRR